jgi:hypothetical protein
LDKQYTIVLILINNRSISNELINNKSINNELINNKINELIKYTFTTIITIVARFITIARIVIVARVVTVARIVTIAIVTIMIWNRLMIND